MNNLTVRVGLKSDRSKIFHLYKRVSSNIGGLARSYEEISQDYIEHFSEQAEKTGIQFVIENDQDNSIIGEIHCYKLTPKVFNHVLSELTIAVDPEFQGKGLGKLLFQSLLKKVREERTDILRVELIARESNEKAITFYQNLGFNIEGRFVNRIDSGNGNFEADIPMAWLNENFGRGISTATKPKKH